MSSQKKISPASLIRQLVLELFPTIPRNLMNPFSGDNWKNKNKLWLQTESKIDIEQLKGHLENMPEQGSNWSEAIN